MKNRLQIAIFLISYCWVACAATAQTPTALYDPLTGSIVLDGLENVGGIQLLSNDNGGIDTLDAANANSLGGFVSATGDQQVDWLFFNPANGGPFDLGTVAPTNVFQTSLDNNYFLGVVIAGSGVSDPRANPIAIRHEDVKIVPHCDGSGGGTGSAEITPANCSTISMQDAFDSRTDLLDDAISRFSDTGIASAVVTDGPEGDVFEAIIDGLNVDLAINGDFARSLPPGTNAEAGLLVTTDDGSQFNYTLTVIVPEPATASLFALALLFSTVSCRRRA